MKRKPSSLSERYLVALRTHLKQGPRASLQPVLGVGREAVVLGLETLELARIHERTLVTELLPGCPAAKRAALIKQAGIFLPWRSLRWRKRIAARGRQPRK